MKQRKNESGFTLVELMVVVAIIGILSAVAIPNFKRYQAKSKTSEAKLQLSAIYSALTALQADYDAFGTCLAAAGYVAPTNNYYAIGFTAASGRANAIVEANGGAGTCPNTGFAFPSNKNVGGYNAPASDVGQINTTSLDNSGTLTTPGVDANGSYFVAGAIGGINADNNTPTTASQWAINENKTLSEINKGF